MSERDEPPAPPPTLAYQNTPNAERYVLEADAMRRRQLRTALLHGSRRNWRDHVRTWPAVVVGIVVVAVIVAGLAVSAALKKTERNQQREQQQQQTPQLIESPRI
jgi:type II secretory pathway component PulL